ncbi:MAG TPA: CPCC family cysteine-rich protein [Rhizomicrobium sp.]|nr:CPCC family cysteine-rich protein [Rhizomicrobium sp.]
MSVLLPCRCCGALTIRRQDAYEVCPVCGWEDDPTQARDENVSGGANRTSLAEARAAWLNRNAQGGE